MADGPRLRANLDDIPTYVPGRVAAPGATQRMYKLSSNENPFPPLPSVLQTITDASTWTNRYPDMFATELVSAIAARFDVPASHVAVGTGSVGVCQQIVQSTAGPGDEVIYAWRSFEAYPILVQVSGATSVQVPLTSTEKHDLDAMLAAITDRTRLILVCTPNNPTGPAIRRQRLERFLDAVPPEILVVVDEAYVEFVRDPEVADGLELYRDRPNVCVLRTFSKAYGLAGLRVGYAVGPTAVAEAIRKCSLPFGVSGVAQAAAVASLGAEPELAQRVKELVAERERVWAGLRDAGWNIPRPEGNFVWFGLGEATTDFAAACGAAGLSVRPFPGEGARVTIGEIEANDRLLVVARSWFVTGD